MGTSSIFFDTQAYVHAGHSLPKLKPISASAREAFTATATNANNGNNDVTEAVTT